MIIGEEILKYKDNILHDIRNLVSIRSVKGSPKANKPFGEEIDQALEYVLALAEKMGFRVKNVDGYAGHAEYGKGDDIIGVLVHLDIVPEGTGWRFPPFEATLHDGKMYGRGVSDNKAPAIVALYSLKTLSDLNLNINKRIRIIFGTDEECGMKDMDYYFSKEPVPDMGFTPDAEYPVINREKGILQLLLSEEAKSPCSDSIIEHIQGGNAVNVVPDNCLARLYRNKLNSDGTKKMQEYVIANSGIFDIKEKEDFLIIESKGKSAHGSTPQEGINAIAHMVDLLGRFAGENRHDRFIEFLKHKIGFEISGQSLGINCSDDSGELTLNLGNITLKDNTMQASLDIRYPVTFSGSEILSRIKSSADLYNIKTEILQHKNPLYVPEDSELIKRLQRAYEKITHKNANLISMGGGTYARKLNNKGVAFGGIGSGAHEADENISIDELMTHAKICTQAIYELTID